MLKRLKSLFSTIQSPTLQADADIDAIAPDRLLLVLGDIHGSFDLMGQAIRRVEEYVEAVPERAAQNPQLIFVGDYIDRGEQSKQVLDWIYDLATQMPDAVTCLMGNHERMMLDFIDDPVGRGARWLRNGGLQALASYNIGRVRENSDAEELVEASLALEAALPEGMLHWLRNLPLQYQSGNVCVVHAAMDPHLAPQDQTRQTMLWGHNEFMSTPRTDGIWVVHGHTIVKEPQLHTQRISIDTGAYHTGRLTAAAIGPGTCEFI
ncbi:MAG: metallophosphoesterase family protein [Sulfitobacter geojensis]